MQYWPEEITAEDVRSPREILEEAVNELEQRNAKLSASVKTTLVGDRLVLSFVVRHRTLRNAAKLFDVVHRPHASYPVSIEAPEFELPDYLRRERQPVATGPLHGSTSPEGLPSTVAHTNEWVCSSPKEFETKLIKLLRREDTVSRVISVATPMKIDGDSIDWNPTPDLSEEPERPTPPLDQDQE